jgi:DGQHR domain-containing protein
MPQYEGILIQQREGEEALLFFAFAAAADEILSWSDIQRTADLHGAAQRLKNTAHIKTIRAFMSASPNNIIPTAVTLAVNPNAFEIEFTGGDEGDRVRFARMTIQQEEGEDAEKAAVIIDGQHRLLAFDPLDDKPPLLACAILGADDLERALHFVVINNKTKRVPSDLVKAIMAELAPDQRDTLNQRLTRVGITLGRFPAALDVLNTDETSPFHQLVDWDINRDGTRRIKPAALESSLRAIIADLRTPMETDVDDAVGILSAMWRGVRESWDVDDVEWCAEDADNVNRHSKLVDKAGLVAVTEFLIQRLNMKIEEGFDITDLDEVQTYCRTVMQSVPSRFWLIEWNERQLDTSAGRGLIRQSLASIRTATSSGADDPIRDAVLVPSTE